MEKVVIDHNIVFSAIISKNSQTRDRLLSEKNIQFYTPNFLILELFKHTERIIRNSKASQFELLNYVDKVFQKIYFFNEELISVENFIEAHYLCKDIDENVQLILLYH